MALQITKLLLPASKYALKCPNFLDPIGVTIHETGNIASAMAEISFMIGNSSSTSYHVAIDDIRAVQGLPFYLNGWHSGDGSKGRGNRKTIGIEHCYNWNGKETTKNDPKYNPLYQKALLNGIEFVAHLFIDYPQWGLPKDGTNMWRHFDHSGKNCPQRMIEENYWKTYVALVKARYLELKNGDAEIGTIKEDAAIKPVATKTIDQLAKEVLSGKYGFGDDRKKALGLNYAAVQKRVNELLNVKKPVVKPIVKPTIKPVVKPIVINKLQFDLPKGVYSYTKRKPLMKGKDVLIIQRALISIYYYPDKGADKQGADGLFGPKTANAVKRFQSFYGLVVDGVFGDNTRNKLNELVNR